MTIRVFLLDDHDVVRAGVVAMIDAEDDLDVVGQARSLAEATTVVAECKPDVAVLDVRLDDGSGIDLCRLLRAEYPNVSTVMLTSFADDQAFVDAADAGASCFVLKQVRGSAVIDAIHRAAHGHHQIDKEALNDARERLRQSGEKQIDELTVQERRIFELIGEGLSNREIGDVMFLAEKTVKNYVSKILTKLGKVRRTEAAALAARLAEREGR
jgi:two-component system response regulator DevR